MWLLTIIEQLNASPLAVGTPALLLALVAGVVLFAVDDRRLQVASAALLLTQSAFFFGAVLDVRLVLVKLVVTVFVCLIVLLTARQVAWPAAAGGRARWIQLLWRTGCALLAAALLVFGAQAWGWQLPLLPQSAQQLVQLLLLLGGLTALFSAEPLQAGLGTLIFWRGFELFFSALDQSLAALAGVALVHLLLALVTARLTLARHPAADAASPNP